MHDRTQIPWGERSGGHVTMLPGTPYRHEHVDGAWVMRSVSPSIEAITGFSREEFICAGGRCYYSIIHPEDLPAVAALFQDALARREPYAIEYRLIHADGSTRWVQGHGQGVYDNDGVVRYVDGVLFDVTARRSSEERLAHLALHDPLTDLPNRALFQEHLAVAVANAERSGSGGAVLFIDLDASSW